MSKVVSEKVYFICNKVVDFKRNEEGTFAATEWRQYLNIREGLLDAALHDIAAFRHIFGAVNTPVCSRPSSG